jgi:TatD DNase family protein
MLTPLDMHAYIKLDIAPSDLRRLGACVAAMTRSLDEYTEVEQRDDPSVAWGVGCHPRPP